MLKHVDQRLNKLYEIQDEIRAAEVRRDEHVARKHVTEGLSFSCIFMRDMIDDENLTRMKGDANVRDKLRDMARRGELGDFLKTERSLLERTKLRSEVVDTLIDALKQIGGAGSVDERLHDRVREFRDTVCKLAEARVTETQHGVVIRRVLIGGGGAMIALLNTFPPVPIQPFYAGLSIGAGIWLIERAMDGPVEAFLKGHWPSGGRA